MFYNENAQLKLAYNFLQLTNQNIFLTGKAGTGKTTFLHNLKKASPKRMVVLAPTGVAAINAGGATIHSFFQMPFGPNIPGLLRGQPEEGQSKNPAIFKLNKTKIDIIRTLDLLVIDEISMVRADLLDGVDEVLRRYRNTTQPFGGVQLLMIGDLQQLAPVIKDDEWTILKDYYDTGFFFSSKALQKTSYLTVELKHIYRQSDQHFIDILNKIRNNETDITTFYELNKRYVKGFTPNDKDGYITLTTHNLQSNDLNQTKLQQLETEPFLTEASIEGNFPAHAYPTEKELILKEGAQVMFVKNDPSQEKLFYNGKIGKITHIEDDIIHVKCLDDHTDIPVGRAEWQNMSYTIDQETKEIKETVEGKFTQYPLKLAWAITIHKSQGLTFEKVVIDAAQAFSHGQVYVALSRCKTLEGIVLSSLIDQSCIINNSRVKQFNQHIEENPVTSKHLTDAQLQYEKDLLCELFNFEQLMKQMYGCQKVLNQYKNFLLGQLDELTASFIEKFRNEIRAVAEKFEFQINQLSKDGSYEQNSALQDRVNKACVYFLEKLHEIVLVPFDGFAIATDNKEIRKEVTETMEKLLTLAIQKKECIEAMQKGFSTAGYLEVRAKSMLKKASKTKPAKKQSEELTDKNIKHPEVFGMLREWRYNESEELNVPVYFVMAQKPLIAIANKLPDNIMELKKIKGIGESKAKKYGAAILEIVKDYKIENNIPIHEAELEMVESNPKKDPKIPTSEVSYNLFRQNISIEDIAQQRGFTVNTILGHLSEYIKTGEIAIEELMDKRKIEKITSYFRNNDVQSLKTVKEALGDDVSYGEIKLVLSSLGHSDEF